MHEIIYELEFQMSQAKTLTQAEIEQVLAFIAAHSFALRNRLIFLTSLYSGMRAKEIAAIKLHDICTANGKVLAEVRLSAEQTKGKTARTVFLPQKLRDELQAYLDIRGVAHMDFPLFITAGRRPFTPNGMALHFFWLYRKCGIAGASSHSGRRTFITNLAGKGIGVRVLASLAGHKSISVTQAYIDVNDDMKRNAVELV